MSSRSLWRQTRPISPSQLANMEKERKKFRKSMQACTRDTMEGIEFITSIILADI
jgi:hypothetical protein